MWDLDSYALTSLSAKSDQHQFSSNNILEYQNIMRINEMITKRKKLWSFVIISQLIQREMCGA